MNSILMFGGKPWNKLPCLEASWPIGPTEFAHWLLESSRVASPNIFLSDGVCHTWGLWRQRCRHSLQRNARHCRSGRLLPTEPEVLVLPRLVFFQLFDVATLQNCDLLPCKHFWNQLLTCLLRSRSSCLPHAATRLRVHSSQLQGPTHDYNPWQMPRILTGLYGIIWFCSALRWHSRCLTALLTHSTLRPSWNVWATYGYFLHSTHRSS